LAGWWEAPPTDPVHELAAHGRRLASGNHPPWRRRSPRVAICLLSPAAMYWTLGRLRLSQELTISRSWSGVECPLRAENPMGPMRRPTESNVQRAPAGEDGEEPMSPGHFAAREYGDLGSP
jgi:hypothetical protein